MIVSVQAMLIQKLELLVSKAIEVQPECGVDHERITAVVRYPARRLPTNSQLLRPSVIGWSWFSTQLFCAGRS